MEKSCRKCARIASPRPLINFGKSPKTAIACDKFYILKEGYQKALKKLTLLFRTQFLAMDKIIKNKRSLELVTSRSSGYKTRSEIFLY